MKKELSSELHNQLVQLTDAGNDLMRHGKYDEAHKKFSDAFRLLPEPKVEWEATAWLLASIGDILFLKKDFLRALRALEDAVRCPGGLGNAFIHLRLGQTAFELGDRERAANELSRAYMGEGRKIFATEDPKYFHLVQKVLRPPEGHSELP